MFIHHPSVQELFPNDAKRFDFMKHQVFTSLDNLFMIERLHELRKDKNLIIRKMATQKAKDLNLIESKKRFRFFGLFK